MPYPSYHVCVQSSSFVVVRHLMPSHVAITCQCSGNPPCTIWFVFYDHITMIALLVCIATVGYITNSPLVFNLIHMYKRFTQSVTCVKFVLKPSRALVPIPTATRSSSPTIRILQQYADRGGALSLLWCFHITHTRNISWTEICGNTCKSLNWQMVFGVCFFCRTATAGSAVTPTIFARH